MSKQKYKKTCTEVDFVDRAAGRDVDVFFGDWLFGSQEHSVDEGADNNSTTFELGPDEHDIYGALWILFKHAESSGPWLNTLKSRWWFSSAQSEQLKITCKMMAKALIRDESKIKKAIEDAEQNFELAQIQAVLPQSLKVAYTNLKVQFKYYKRTRKSIKTTDSYVRGSWATPDNRWVANNKQWHGRLNFEQWSFLHFLHDYDMTFTVRVNAQTKRCTVNTVITRNSYAPYAAAESEYESDDTVEFGVPDQAGGDDGAAAAQPQVVLDEDDGGDE